MGVQTFAMTDIGAVNLMAFMLVVQIAMRQVRQKEQKVPQKRLGTREKNDFKE